jgi:hypothetical protein
MQSGPDEVRVGEDAAIDFGHTPVQVEQFRPAIFAPQEARSDSTKRVACLDDVVGTAIALVDSIAGQRYPEDPTGQDHTGLGEALTVGHLASNIHGYQSGELIPRSVKLLGDPPQGVTGLHNVFCVRRSLAGLLTERKCAWP